MKDDAQLLNLTRASYTYHTILCSGLRLFKEATDHHGLKSMVRHVSLNVSVGTDATVQRVQSNSSSLFEFQLIFPSYMVFRKRETRLS